MTSSTAAFLLQELCLASLRKCRASFLPENMRTWKTLTSIHFPTAFDGNYSRQTAVSSPAQFRQGISSSQHPPQTKGADAFSSVRFLSETSGEPARSSATSTNLSPKHPLLGPSDSQKPISNWEKFKDMYKKYWYVLIPVHGALSVGFMVILYYIVKSGVDVVPLLEKLGVPEKIIAPVRKSGASAYVAAAYAIYHLISPLRYAVTLGLTTLTITYLKRFGYIKPVPSSKRIKEMYDKGRERVQVFSKRLTGKKSRVAKRGEK